MELYLVLNALAVVCALYVAITLTLRGKRVPPLVGKTVVVHTKVPDSRSIRGVLHGQHIDRWVLDQAELLQGQRVLALEGVQHIPIENIAFAQEVVPGMTGPTHEMTEAGRIRAAR